MDFCIISWSSPVMVIVIKAPAKICFTKYNLSDGSVKNKKYFAVVGGSKYGIFIRPKDANFGDFPALDDFNAEEDEI